MQEISQKPDEAIYGRNTDEMDGSQFSGNSEARKETFDTIAGSFQLLNEKNFTFDHRKIAQEKARHQIHQDGS